MLSLVVGSAAAVDAVVDPGRPPRIQIVPPFAGHAVDDVAMSVHQNRRRGRIFAIFSEKVGFPPVGDSINLVTKSSCANAGLSS